MKQRHYIKYIVIVALLLMVGGIYYFQPHTISPQNPSQKNSSDIHTINLEKEVGIAEFGTDVEPFCSDESLPLVTIHSSSYFDFDKNGKDEVLVSALSCNTGTAGADIVGVYSWDGSKLTKIPRTHPEYNDSRKNYGLKVEQGQLVETFPIYKKGDPNCCPSGGIRKIYYTFNNSMFEVEKVVERPEEDSIDNN
ncbi:MAG: hypothetical protein V4481_04735 [Patescibacteria group bacterium]